jgi:hypothetical protein
MVTSNSNIVKPKNKIPIAIPMFFGFGLVAILIFLFYSEFFNSKTEFDIPNKENSKIVEMFDKQIQYQIEQHTQSHMNPGYIEGSRQQTINFLSTISSIESYARYGVTSTQSRNYLEMKITFNNGTVAEKVYTGLSCSGYFEPCLLMKVFLKNGKTAKIYTNGSEKRGSPDNIINDLNTLINRAISYDISRNHDAYFPKEKNQKDFDNEWENK